MFGLIEFGCISFASLFWTSWWLNEHWHVLCANCCYLLFCVHVCIVPNQQLPSHLAGVMAFLTKPGMA